MIPAVRLLIITFFCFLSLISIACFLKDPQNVLMKFLPLYTSCLFSMLLNDDIVDIEEPGGICLLNFVAEKCSGLFLHPSAFSLKYSRSA